MPIAPPVIIAQRREGRRIAFPPPSSSPSRLLSRLEQSSRPQITRYVLDGRLDDVARIGRGVYDRAIARRDANMGCDAATVLAPEHQISCLGCSRDRSAVAHLRLRIVRQ